MTKNIEKYEISPEQMTSKIKIFWDRKEPLKP